MSNITNFPNGVSSMGVPLPSSGIPVTYGRYIFVDADNGNDGNDGRTLGTAVKTVAQAYSLATTNANDVILLSAYSDHTITAMLNITKNRVHFFGLGVGRRKYGQRSRIVMGVTTAVTDIFAVKNIGIGNTFSNIKIVSNNTNANTIGAFGEGGEYTSMNNVEIYDSTNLTSDTHAELVLNGDSPQFFDCTFGSIADAIVGDKVRPAIITTGGAVSGALSGGVSRDVYFEGCNLWKNAGGTTTAFVKIADDNDLERYMEFKDCSFVANKLGSVPAVAIASATLTKSQVNLTGSTSSANCTKLATATGIISSLPARVATATIGIQTS